MPLLQDIEKKNEKKKNTVSSFDFYPSVIFFLLFFSTSNYFVSRSGGERETRAKNQNERPRHVETLDKN